MPIYFYWGDDDFALTKAVKTLQETVLDPNWLSFNYEKISGEQSDSITQSLNQAMTPVFGAGGRLVWVENTTLGQQSSEAILTQLERVLPAIPDPSHLLFTASKKPDKRLKTTKLLAKYATVQSFSLIAPWNRDELRQHIQHIAAEVEVKLTPKAIELLCDSVGNNTRQLWNELEKLKLYRPEQMLNEKDVEQLVNATNQNSLQLTSAIRKGKIDEALGLVQNLINRNEPALKIVATLVGQFRTWTMIKLYLENGEKDDKLIATDADLNNPKRLYFIRKEIQWVSAKQLLATLPLLYDLEYQLKRGSEPLSTLQTKVIELCQIFVNKNHS